MHNPRSRHNSVEQLIKLSVLSAPNEYRTLQDSVPDDANPEAWERLSKGKMISSAHLSVEER
jgi:hypothetical protein